MSRAWKPCSAGRLSPGAPCKPVERTFLQILTNKTGDIFGDMYTRLRKRNHIQYNEIQVRNMGYHGLCPATGISFGRYFEYGPYLGFSTQTFLGRCMVVNKQKNKSASLHFSIYFSPQIKSLVFF